MSRYVRLQHLERLQRITADCVWLCAELWCAGVAIGAMTAGTILGFLSQSGVANVRAGDGAVHMKVVVLAGPESSGKSWLAAQLQAHFGGLLVGEYVRYFIEQNPRDTCLADIPTIARGQLEWEDQARALQPELLILDTHLLSNMLWSQTLFGDCPDWLQPQLLSRRYDLHLLLSPDDVEWTQDGQRCQPLLAERQGFFNASRQWLEHHQQPLHVLTGDWNTRQQQAFAAVERLLA